MNNAVLLQHAFDKNIDEKSGDFRPMIELTRERNTRYCEMHDFDLRIQIGALNEKYTDPFKGEWCKVDMILNALNDGYQYIVWLDADALIKDMSADLRDGCPHGLGVCWHRIPQGAHWNTGVIYARNTEAVKAFMDEWLSKYPGNPQWMEQGEFNQLARRSPVVETISDRWNATLNYSMVPDAVVLGYHGYGIDRQRLEAMQTTLKALEVKNGANITGNIDQ